MSDKYKGTILAGIVFTIVFCFMFGIEALLAVVPMIVVGMMIIVSVWLLDFLFRDRRRKAYVKLKEGRKNLI